MLLLIFDWLVRMWGPETWCRKRTCGRSSETHRGGRDKEPRWAHTHYAETHLIQVRWLYYKPNLNLSLRAQQLVKSTNLSSLVTASTRRSLWTTRTGENSPTVSLVRWPAGEPASLRPTTKVSSLVWGSVVKPLDITQSTLQRDSGCEFKRKDSRDWNLVKYLMYWSN